MIADTNFLSAWLRERRAGFPGPAAAFMAAHRREVIRTSVVSVGELAPIFAQSHEVWTALKRWTIYRLHDGIVNAAADVDRAMIADGTRLGENDNWIAGFCRYYRQPIISRDRDFDRIAGLRRLEW